MHSKRHSLGATPVLALMLGVLMPAPPVTAQAQLKKASEEPKRLDRSYLDEDYGVTVSVAGHLRRINPARFNVPGEVCRAWSPSQNASIVLFVQRPGKPLTARFLLDESVQSMKLNLGAEAKQQDVANIAGMQSMSLVVTGNGSGTFLSQRGPIPTSQRWAAIPRETDIVVFLLTAPEKDFAAANKALDAMLQSLKLSGTQTDAQKDAK